jgi:hypothetical protein
MVKGTIAAHENIFLKFADNYWASRYDESVDEIQGFKSAAGSD